VRRGDKPLHPADEYVEQVLNGEITACRWVKLACQRHKDDLKEGGKRGLWFDYAEADRVLQFFGQLRLWKGKEYQGKPFSLAPHFQFIVSSLFGWKRKDGTRRFRIGYVEVARKSSKSTIAGGCGAFMFLGTNEHGAEIYCAAVKSEQAKIVWTNIQNLTKNTPFAEHITYHRHNLSIEQTWSKCEPLSADTKSMDGLDTYFGVLDELHAHPTPEVHDLLCDSTGARLEPLILIITTAGFNQTGVCFQRRDYLTRILKKVIEDDSFFGIVYTLDRKADWPELQTPEEHKNDTSGKLEDDWEDEDNWVKANPGILGISKSGERYGIDAEGNPLPGYMTKIEKIREEAAYAKETPAALNNFLTKKMSVWTGQFSRWISLDLWDGNYSNEIDEEKLKGRVCYGGIDIAATLDLTPWVMVFPRDDGSQKLDVIMRCWCPEARLYEKENRYKEFYQAWVRQGFLKTTPGNVVDYDFIREQIYEDAKKFKIDSIAIDRLFQGYEFASKLDSQLGGTEDKPKVAPCGMGFKSMTPLTLELERRLKQKQINHGANPVLRWMADNVSVKVDPSGGKKPDKSTSQGKIDGIIALLLSLDRILRPTEPVKPKSVYETRGFASV